MTMAFTPGPWGVEPETEGSGQWVVGPDGEYVATGYGRFSGDPEGIANAHLIAAAPDLFAALERAKEELRLIRMKDTGAVYDVLLRVDIDAALAKARALSPGDGTQAATEGGA